MQRHHRALRAQVSLLLSEGHRYANQYPLSKVWIESELVRERVNGRISTDASMMHAVIVAVLSPDGKGNKSLQSILRKLNDGH